MASSIGQFDRHTAYRRLSRMLFPQRYLGKILLLTFIAAHIPLLALVAYTVIASPFDATHVVRVLAVGLAATLAGAGLALGGLWVLLTPVVKASEALETYRGQGVRQPLPTDLDDEGGRLMANVHGTLEGLDATVARLNVLATHDDLTGVYNRREGARLLLDEVNAGGAGGAGTTLILIDVDNLKRINDEWGHSVGDQVLQLLAGTIARCVKDHGWVSRWGGDEFVAVVRDTGSGSLAKQLVAAVRDDLERVPVRVDGGEFRIRLSTGVARYEPGDDAQAMFNRADGEFYRAKRMRGPTGGRMLAGYPDHPVS